LTTDDRIGRSQAKVDLLHRPDTADGWLQVAGDALLTAVTVGDDEFDRLQALHRLSRDGEDGVECGATAKTVWRWERGERPNGRYRRLLCTLYDATPEELGFRPAAPDSTEQPDASLTGEEDDDVRRRTLLSVLGGAMLGPFEHQFAGLASAVARTPAGQHVDEWERAADAYAYELATVAPGRLLPNLIVDFEQVREVLEHDRLDAHQRRRLTRVAAQLAALIADTLIWLGERAASRRWSRAARGAADEAGDPVLAAAVRGKQAIRALYGVHAPTGALDLADEAVAAAHGVPCAGVMSALAARAQAHAGMGRRRDAECALADLTTTFERQPDDVTRGGDALHGWSEAKFHHVESYVYTYLGDSTRAGQAQERALALYSSSAWRGPAQIELHRATCLVHDGDIGGGIGHATEVMGALPQKRRRDGFVQAIAQATATAVPRCSRALAPVRDYRELVALPPGT
jgi:hypothetical protein